jgi:hypothetical protein
MSAPQCDCARGRRPRFLALLRGGARSVGGVLVAALLALMPKCPACLAAYVAAWTGLGLSVAAASYLRVSLVVLCLASLLFLLARPWRRFTHPA